MQELQKNLDLKLHVVVMVVVVTEVVMVAVVVMAVVMAVVVDTVDTGKFFPRAGKLSAHSTHQQKLQKRFIHVLNDNKIIIFFLHA